MQENNHLVVVDLKRARVTADFTAGTVDVGQIDTTEEELGPQGNGVISLDGGLDDRRREPDTVQWIDDDTFATANEGDYVDENGVEGGSRSFTLFNVRGHVEFEAGNAFEHEIVRAGHYPESRSENKGNEPEGLEVGRHRGRTYLFVASERADAVGVYDVSGRTPRFLQLLPTAIGPEGLHFDDGVLAVTSETDGADEGFLARPIITLFELDRGRPAYPQLVSGDDARPADPVGRHVRPRRRPRGQRHGVGGQRLRARPGVPVRGRRVGHAGGDHRADRGRWRRRRRPSARRLRPRGRRCQAGGRLLGGQRRAHERRQLAAEPHRATRRRRQRAGSRSPCLPTSCSPPTAAGSKASPSPVRPPTATRPCGWRCSGSGRATRAGLVKLGRYDVATATWTFAQYPLDPVESPNGGFVGLSELTLLDDGTLAVVERDNQLGQDARIKRIYGVDPASVEFVPFGQTLPVLEKTLLADVLDDLDAASISVPDKLEGLAVTVKGDVYVVTDNDGVDENYGETIFLDLGRIG